MLDHASGVLSPALTSGLPVRISIAKVPWDQGLLTALAGNFSKFGFAISRVCSFSPANEAFGSAARGDRKYVLSMSGLGYPVVPIRNLGQDLGVPSPVEEQAQKGLLVPDRSVAVVHPGWPT